MSFLQRLGGLELPPDAPVTRQPGVLMGAATAALMLLQIGLPLWLVGSSLPLCVMASMARHEIPVASVRQALWRPIAQACSVTRPV